MDYLSRLTSDGGHCPANQGKIRESEKGPKYPGKVPRGGLCIFTDKEYFFFGGGGLSSESL